MSEVKLCECGCGQPAPIATYNSKRWGWVKGQPKRFIHNHHHRGHRNVNYNHGLHFSKSQKRWFISCLDRTYTPYARAVMENHLGRPLTKREVVHHINHDSADDRIENLRLEPSHSFHMSKEHRLSDREILNALRNMAGVLGRAPKTSDFPHPGMVTRETLRARFGGLQAAVRKAGIAS